MLENERIIVQDRGGIDAGIAALMQNANKGFDPAALMAMMNNGNGMFGGNGGWWWIFIIVLFWMWGGWGGNGFGRGNQAETNSDFARLAAMGNQNNNYVTRRTHCNLLHCYNNRLLISLVKLDLVRFLLT